MTSMSTFCENLSEAQRHHSMIASINSVLQWDGQCIMPPKGAKHRGKQQAFVMKHLHELKTSSSYEDLLKRAEDETLSLDDNHPNKILTQKSRRAFDRQKLIPSELVASIEEATASGISAWMVAREKRDFSEFRPALESIIKLLKTKYSLLHPSSKLYDGLLADYDWGLTSAYLDRLYEPLRGRLSELLRRQKASSKARKSSDSVSEELQKKICNEILDAFGLDPEVCVLAKSEHPFSATLGPRDFRITTRYFTQDFTCSLLAAGHEMGHSLYEQGLPGKYEGTILGNAASYGVHESQSLFWEKQVMCSRPFLRNWWPRVKNTLASSSLNNESFDCFYDRFNSVRPSLVRVDADEVSYCLHIMIRYEIEKAIFSDDFDIAELPSIWNENIEHIWV